MDDPRTPDQPPPDSDRRGHVPCPRCGRPGIPILYGDPSPGMLKAEERGEIALGGCVVTDDDPTHQCPAGHRWVDPRT